VHLSRHKRVHTGEKPYRCVHAGCTYAGTQRQHLEGHVKRHSCTLKCCEVTDVSAQAEHRVFNPKPKPPAAAAAGLR